MAVDTEGLNFDLSRPRGLQDAITSCLVCRSEVQPVTAKLSAIRHGCLPGHVLCSIPFEEEGIR